MFILDILVYVIFACIMSKLAKKSYNINPAGRKWDSHLILFVAFYTIICAFRWNVGVDSAGYAYMFEYGNPEPISEADGEVLFYFMQNISAKLHLPFVFGMGLCAFLQIFFITKTLKEYKYVLIALPIVLFGSRYFLDLNNGVRQMIVASMFVYFSKYIAERKFWRYAIWILIASTIHHSAFMLLPFYLLPNKLKVSDKRVLMLLIFMVCFVAGQTPSFRNMIGFAESLSNIFGYEGYTERVGTFLAEGQTEEALSFGPMMLSYLLTALFTIWFGPELAKKYEPVIPYFNLWYNLSFFFACAYFLVCNISHIFIRPVQYFELFQLVIVSLLLYDLGIAKGRRKVMYAILILTLWVSVSWNIIKVDRSGNDWESTTYKVFFLHQDQVDRFFNVRKINE